MSHPKAARADHAVLEVIERRWSPRAFDPARDVARADLLRLFEAARWAPSGSNEQPWRFVAVSRLRSPDQFAALVATLLPKNRAWAESAPIAVLVAVHHERVSSGAPRAGAWYDAGQAVAFLTLQATSMDLAVRQMEGFDADAARRVCHVPDAFTPAVVMAIGYAGDPESLAIESHRHAERQPRTRRPIREFVFENTWNQPIS